MGNNRTAPITLLNRWKEIECHFLVYSSQSRVVSSKSIRSTPAVRFLGSNLDRLECMNMMNDSCRHNKEALELSKRGPFIRQVHIPFWIVGKGRIRNKTITLARSIFAIGIGCQKVLRCLAVFCLVSVCSWTGFDDFSSFKRSNLLSSRRISSATLSLSYK